MEGITLAELDTIPADGLPVFPGETWEDHVETWNALDEGVSEAKWRMAAVAASLTAKWGEKGEVLGRFAYECKTSARRVYEYAYTYRAWQSRERSQILSFHHHTIAARCEEPESAIERAEVEELSTRELKSLIAQKERPEGEDASAAAATVVCPRCGGDGRIASDSY